MKCGPGGIILTPLNLTAVSHAFKSIPNSVPIGTSKTIKHAPSKSSLLASSWSISMDSSVIFAKAIYNSRHDKNLRLKNRQN